VKPREIDTHVRKTGQYLELPHIDEGRYTSSAGNGRP
jgi:hypothetical protein